jgi:AraC-like DNA-binding protein
MSTSEGDKKCQILFSCYSQLHREGEQFIPDHAFGMTIAGGSDVSIGKQAYQFREGQYHFCKKNQLARYVKYPPAGGEYLSISVFMDQDTLRSISEEHKLYMSRPYTGDPLLFLKPNNLFSNYMESLKPYLNNSNQISKALTNIKRKEAIMILLETNPSLKDILFDFSEPGKIDLEAYMNEHYKFNVDLNRFAYLTGRSLATFKRDFEKIFNTSPNRWLQKKRLNDAYYLIKEKGWRSSDVYLEVGFKDFSHFSFAFKKAFGIAPSLVSSIQ